MPQHHDAQFPFTVDISDCNGGDREEYAQAASYAGAAAAYGAIRDEIPEFKWVTLRHHGRERRREPGTGKWQEKIRRRILGHSD